MNDVIYDYGDGDFDTFLSEMSLRNGITPLDAAMSSIQDTRYRSNLLMQLFMPLVTSQRVLSSVFHTSYDRAQCFGGTELLMRKYLRYQCVCLGRHLSLRLEQIASIILDMARFICGHLIELECVRKRSLLTLMIESYLMQRDKCCALRLHSLRHVFLAEQLQQSLLHIAKCAVSSLPHTPSCHCLLLWDQQIVCCYSGSQSRDLSSANLLHVQLLLTALAQYRDDVCDAFVDKSDALVDENGASVGWQQTRVCAAGGSGTCACVSCFMLAGTSDSAVSLVSADPVKVAPPSTGVVTIYRAHVHVIADRFSIVVLSDVHAESAITLLGLCLQLLCRCDCDDATTKHHNQLIRALQRLLYCLKPFCSSKQMQLCVARLRQLVKVCRSQTESADLHNRQNQIHHIKSKSKSIICDLYSCLCMIHTHLVRVLEKPSVSASVAMATRVKRVLTAGQYQSVDGGICAAIARDADKLRRFWNVLSRWFSSADIIHGRQLIAYLNNQLNAVTHCHIPDVSFFALIDRCDHLLISAPSMSDIPGSNLASSVNSMVDACFRHVVDQRWQTIWSDDNFIYIHSVWFEDVLGCRVQFQAKPLTSHSLGWCSDGLQRYFRRLMDTSFDSDNLNGVHCFEVIVILSDASEPNLRHVCHNASTIVSAVSRIANEGSINFAAKLL